MSDSFEKLLQKLDWVATKERADWLRWIVLIEAILLGLSVSLYKPEISLHHPHPSLLKLAWAALAVSILCGVVGATGVASVRESLVKEMLEIQNSDRQLEWVQRFSQEFPVRRPNASIRACQILCPILLANRFRISRENPEIFPLRENCGADFHFKLGHHPKYTCIYILIRLILVRP